MAFGLYLRPGEYLVIEEETPLTHQANAGDCFFVFNDDECVYVCDPDLYPVGRTPSFFLCMFTSPEHFCCVLTLFAYFCTHPGRRETLALSTHGTGVIWSK